MANLKHGGHKYLSSGRLPPGHEDVEKELEEFYAGVVALYCPDGPNSHQEALLRRAVNKLGFIKLCEINAWERGPLQVNEKGHAEMLPSLSQQYIAFTNGFRLDMRELRDISLGKEKKSDLEDYLEKHYGKKAKDDKKN